MKRNLRLILLLLIFAIFGLNGALHAQYLPGKRDSINSAILNEKRFIEVVFPQNYNPAKADKYDVLYVLDGEGNTKLAMDLQRYLEGENYMPPIIIVGIINTDRNRDLTPTHVNDTKTSGGADKFLAFIKNELIPYVDKKYPTDGDNAIFGHSFGGLFVMHALLNEPHVFTSYIAADPSFWWDKGFMVREAANKMPAIANLRRTLYMTGRDDDLIGMGIPPMDTLLRKYAPADLVWKLTAYTGETHGSVRLKSMYDGLKYIYGGYNTKSPGFHPANGTLLKDKPITLLNFNDTTRLRYTLDGSEPLLTSAKMGKELTLTGPARVTVKLFSNRDKYNKIAVGDFKIGAPWPAHSKVKNIKPGGFHYNYYEGEWDKLPDFSTLTPVKSGIADSAFDLNKLPRQNNFALLFDGWMEVKEEGYYLFGLASDDGSRFFINNQKLLDNDGLHDLSGLKSYIVPLQKGFYPIRLEYFQKDGGKDLKLIYLIPSTINTKHPTPIPLELQYSKE
ncbi:alpha/beta hydrolase-fold protein [Mucilaginibacter gotjawali]|uniref:Alpha/beta superfamily hydrolase n=2 Tax=Mucilaginibacter gotjawali TaxID=1550579 RepID=A0A839SKC2_9SPHI|nr:alpha/beta hydrolase-fold protein [Mucilaginibacter gotjawali]MBB3057912.1 putative alpha/beta superfamily hydrolase [Mucilaginibacter gotjawali]BAU52316.1 Ferri-bacillibactin esterase BesA [Mucilaginibacter gotjawali]